MAKLIVVFEGEVSWLEKIKFKIEKRFRPTRAEIVDGEEE